MKILKLLILSLLLIPFIQCSEERIDGVGTGTISGIVVTIDTNERVPDARVSTQPATSTVFTDENGAFIINNVPEGSYSVEVSKDGFVTAFEAANVLPNVTIDLVFDLDLESSLNQSPTTPILIAPENNTLNTPLDVLLEWEATDPDEDDILLYKVSVFNENNDIVEEFTDVSEMSLQLSNLALGTKYFWQVTVNDGVNPPLLSAVFTFTTLSSQTGTFLLVKNMNNNQVIFSSDEDGNLFQLTSENANSFKPRRNLATGKIAFLRTIGGQTHLFTMDPDGTNQQQITNSIPVSGFNFDEIEFAWKPGGDLLLYPSFNKIYSINPNGSGLSEFYETSNGNFVSEIAWSALNNIIAIKTNNNIGYDVEILIINTAGVAQETILSGVEGAAGGLDLNIDGSMVLYTYDVSGLEFANYSLQDSRLFIYNRMMDTNEQLNTDVAIGFNELDPKFSPAENSVLYQQKARNINAVSQIRIHSLTSTTTNSEILYEDAMMPDWED